MPENEKSGASGSAKTPQDSDSHHDGFGTPKRKRKEPKSPTSSQISKLADCTSGLHKIFLCFRKTYLNSSQDENGNMRRLFDAAISGIDLLTLCR